VYEVYEVRNRKHMPSEPGAQDRGQPYWRDKLEITVTTEQWEQMLR
jgi:hypothetical protein